jgi:hypothetical protein
LGGSSWFFARKVTVPARPYLPTRPAGCRIDWQDTIVRETGLWLMGNA